MKNGKTGEILQFIGAIILVLLLSTVAKPCAADKPMACTYSVDVVRLFFIAMASTNIFSLLQKTGQKYAWNLLQIVLLVEILWIPTVAIGGCKMATMACRVRSFPTIYVGAGILLVTNILSIMLKLKKEKW